jgi:hypothetical protein
MNLSKFQHANKRCLHGNNAVLIPELLTYLPREMSGFRWLKMGRAGSPVWAVVRERLILSAVVDERRSAW